MKSNIFCCCFPSFFPLFLFFPQKIKETAKNTIFMRRSSSFLLDSTWTSSYVWGGWFFARVFASFSLSVSSLCFSSLFQLSRFACLYTCWTGTYVRRLVSKPLSPVSSYIAATGGKLGHFAGTASVSSYCLLFQAVCLYACLYGVHPGGVDQERGKCGLGSPWLVCTFIYLPSALLSLSLSLFPCAFVAVRQKTAREGNISAFCILIRHNPCLQFLKQTLQLARCQFLPFNCILRISAWNSLYHIQLRSSPIHRRCIFF